MTRAHRKEHGPDWVQRLPEILRDRAMLCAAERHVSPELPALVSLAAIATCLGKGIVVQSGADRWTHGNVFILLSAASGTGKTEAFRDMLGPVVRFESELHDWWSDEALPRARAGMELFKTIVAGIRQNVKTARTPALPAFRIVEDLERKKEVCGRYLDAPCLVADDATPEALALAMDRSNGCIALASADARQILKRLSMTDSKEESLALKGYSGDLSIISRVSRRGVRLRSPCLTLLFLTQPDAYRRFLSKSAQNRSGLLPRFLHASFEIKNSIRPFSRRISQMQEIRSKYQELLENLIETFRFEKEPATVVAEPAALQLLEKLEKEARLTVGATEVEDEIQRRHVEQVWRISLILHAARNGRKAAAASLTLNDAKNAVEIVTRLTRLRGRTDTDYS